LTILQAWVAIPGAAAMPDHTEDLRTDPLLLSAPLLEGFKVLDPAVLYAKVGEGGMGAVYRGRHLNIDCDVAVKVLKPELARNDQFVARFQREARLAARIKNDHVVQVLDVREQHGIHYLMMEFVRGETARERVRRKGALGQGEALAIVYGIARGLRAAHLEGIVHRDIKPENVLIGIDGRVKVADLGLAKSRRAWGEQSLTLLTSGVMGTPQYMPPEQWRSGEVSAAADVWAIGATLWFLLAGRNAIGGGELLEIGEQIRDCDFPELPPKCAVRPEVAAVLQKCVARRPADRFADARELCKALQPLVGAIDDEELADPEGQAQNSRVATVTPPPRATLAKIKVHLLTERGGTQAQPGPAPRSELPTIPTRPPRRRSAGWLVALLLVVAVLGGGGAYAAGWFDAGRPASSAGPLASPTPEPPVEPLPSLPPIDADSAADARAEADAAAARAAYERGCMVLPLAGRLDDAIAAFEAALALPDGLARAGLLADCQQRLVAALVQKAEILEASDLDGAWDRLDEAQRLAAADERVREAKARVEDALRARLLAGLEVEAPKDGAVLDARSVAVRGAMRSAHRAVRVAVVPAADAGAAFPRATSASLIVTAERFAARLAVPADGAYCLRVEVEDRRGLVAEPPPGRTFVVDTAEPEVAVVAPQPGTTVGPRVAVEVEVVDDSPRSVRVAGIDCARGDDGRYRAVLDLGSGEQTLVVVATDAVGKATRRMVPVLVDATPPSIELRPVPAVTSGTPLVVGGTVRDGESLQLDGRAVPLAAGGAFSLALPLAEEREHEFVLVASDAVGNACEPVRVKVRYDASAPELAWTSPEGGVVPAGDVVVSGTVRDAGACEVFVGAARATVEGASWSAVVSVAAGQRVDLRVTARDAAGNEARPLIRTLRGEFPLVVPAWADRASDAKDVEIDGRRYPSVVVEKQTGMRMVLVRPGQFRMGSPASEQERGSDEQQHTRVIQQAFWLGETEVTQAQWQKVMGSNPSRFQGAENPVERVSWDDCQQFFAKLNGGTGGGFRLPSEAEWEYACRAGTSAPFSFGPNITPEQVNYDGNHPYAGGSKGRYRERTVPVRSLPPNAWGLYEMHGNVWEWCADAYVENYPQDGADQTPVQGGALRVVRGGSWHDVARSCRAAVRIRDEPANRDGRVGFRASRTLE
jgi:formylglycine-generating enzyme required for sulfatase activity